MILYIFLTRGHGFVVGYRNVNKRDQEDEEIYCKDLNELMSWIEGFFGNELWN